MKDRFSFNSKVLLLLFSEYKMLDYQTLDTLADTYTPLLALLCLGSLIFKGLKRDWQQLIPQGSLLILGLLVAYGLMFIDNRLAIWPAMELDYSTHTAVALALVISLMAQIKSLKFYWLGSLLAYGALMRYQEYHSIADMLSTALVNAVLLLPLTLPLKLTKQAQPEEATMSTSTR